ncbi:MAG: L-serine ammonia-lyase, iron-sulfur-dependent, subunit alpha [Clostridia bacterium]|nr:L-serine ammonia-lyase, iron-sulfur-dependent, subunit alpha [Clostridia bacterium]
MERNSETYQTYVEILNRELVSAMGCTEPIAIAYCAAKARSILGDIPDIVKICASGNIIKNVKSVVVPNTEGRRGIKVAAAAGIIGGNENGGLLVIADIPPGVKYHIEPYLAQAEMEVEALDSESLLEVEITVAKGDESAKVHIKDEHTNIVSIEKNGEVIFEKQEGDDAAAEGGPDYTMLTVADIIDFADTCELVDVAEILEKQIRCNMEIAEEGLKGDFGANVGKTIMMEGQNNIRTKAKAYAAAGSDARMGGCELPVVINSGSGNQGLTTSVPVILYAEEAGVSHETLLRGLLVANLVTLHAKTDIGRLSAYCGVVTAGAGAAAGIAYINGGDRKTISHTIVNTLAISSGIVCDGAKASCAAKIAVAVESGLLGYEMYQNGQEFYDGDGLVLKGVENTIRNYGYLGRVAMHETNTEIIHMMIKPR